MTAIRIKRVVDSETLHIPELRPLLGHEIEIIVLDETGGPVKAKAAQATPIWEEAQEIISQVPSEELDNLPADAAEQHDHYLYGLQKKAS